MVNGYFSIADLDVKDGTGPNQATTAVASATSLNVDVNHNASKVNDGNTATTYYSGNSPTLPQYVTLNWSTAQSFDNVTLNVIFGKNSGPSGWDIEVSTDGSTNWTKVATTYPLAANQLANDVTTIGNDGFNVMHVSYDINNGFDTSFLDLANTKGVRIISSSYEQYEKYDIVNTFKNHPSILGWDIADDVDNDVNGMSLAAVTSRNNQVKAWDPNHLTYVSTTKTSAEAGNNNATYKNVVDIEGAEIYPINRLPLRDVYLRAEDAKNVMDSVNKPSMSLLQTFSWFDPTNRNPTVPELNNMTYQAIAAGTKGIMYYKYYDGFGYIDSNLYNETKALVPEINALSPILLTGQRTKVPSADIDLYQTYWKYNNKLYVVVVNTSYDTLSDVLVWGSYTWVARKTIQASISLPDGYKDSTVKPMFSRYPSTLTIRNGVLTGSVAPEGVQIYEVTPLNLALSATVTATSVDAPSPVTNINDGTTNTFYLSAKTSPSFPQYVTLTYPQAQSFNNVLWKMDYAQYQAPTNFDIQVSDDGLTNWTTVASLGTINWATNNSTIETKSLSFSRVTNKKGIRVKINNASYVWGFFGARELEVYDDAPSANLVTNPGFENDAATQTPTGWSTWSTSGLDSDADFTTTGTPFAGTYYARQYKASAYDVYTFQTKTGLTNGKYVMKAWVRSSGGQAFATMQASLFGSVDPIILDISAASVWTQ